VRMRRKLNCKRFVETVCAVWLNNVSTEKTRGRERELCNGFIDTRRLHPPSHTYFALRARETAEQGFVKVDRPGSQRHYPSLVELAD